MSSPQVEAWPSLRESLAAPNPQQHRHTHKRTPPGFDPVPAHTPAATAAASSSPPPAATTTANPKAPPPAHSSTPSRQPRPRSSRPRPPPTQQETQGGTTGAATPAAAATDGIAQPAARGGRGGRGGQSGGGGGRRRGGVAGEGGQRGGREARGGPGRGGAPEDELTSSLSSLDHPSEHALRGRGGGRGGGRGRGGRGGKEYHSYGQADDPSQPQADGTHRGGRGRGGGRGGRGRGGRGGGGVIPTIYPVPADASSSSSSPPPPAAAPSSSPSAESSPSAAPAPAPSSFFQASEDGVFRLVTSESQSRERDGVRPVVAIQERPTTTRWSEGDTIMMSDIPAASGETSTAEADAADADPSSSSSPDPPVDASSPDSAPVDDAWFTSDTSALPDPSLFTHDEVTNDLLEFIGTLVDGDVEGLELTNQQASVMRYLVVRGKQEMREMVQRFQEDSSDPTSFLAAITPLIEHQLSVEDSCRGAQRVELDVLQSIFGSSSRELTLYETYPLTLKVTVVLREFDCHLELGFMLPPSYPDEEPLMLNTFIPPPYQGLKILMNMEGDQAEGGAGDPEKQLVCIDDLLQARLQSRASELVGESSVYSLIEEARSFMEQHITVLKTSLEAQHEAEQQNAAASRALQLDSIAVFGRGRIEKLEYEAIQAVQQECALPESIARAKLKEHKWDTEACIEEYKKKGGQQVEVQEAADSEQRLEHLFSLFSSYRFDPDATLSCSSCFEDLQLREVAGQSCCHVMCLLCWRRMLATHISQGQAFLRCVGHKCPWFVEEGLLMTLLSTADYARYRRWLQDSFIRLRGWRWCVNPSCDKVAACTSASGQYAVVSCPCRSLWCFSCGRTGHWPISCAASRLYDSSALVQRMRTVVRDRIGQVRHEDDHIKVEVKPCPKCKTPWEKNGGCNHIKCGNCDHHYCFVCLQGWELHGISWFKCKFGEGDKKAERLVFTGGLMLSNNLNQIYNYCERELVHYLSAVRIQRILREIEVRKQMQATGATVAPRTAQDQAFPPELPGLLADLSFPLLSLLTPLLTFLHESHCILRSTYIFFILHHHHLDSSLRASRRQLAANKLMFDLNQVEYFVDRLDTVLIPLAGTARLKRTIPQLQELVGTVKKYTKILSETVEFFQATHPARKVVTQKPAAGSSTKDSGEEEFVLDEETNTKAFFQALDEGMAQIGRMR